MSPINIFIICFTICINNTTTYCERHETAPLANPVYNMYEVIAFNSRERSLLCSIDKHFIHMYFLNGVSNEAGLPVYVAVANCCINQFENMLVFHGVQFSLLPSYSTLHGQQKKDRDEQRFRSWDNINKWIKSAQKNYPDILSKERIGKTSQLRRLNVLKVSQKTKNIAVFILGGEDARDWVSSEIVLLLVEEVLRYGTPLNKLTNYCDFYFLPLLNPDGYEYSRTMNRFWAKNRRPIFLHPHRNCKEDEKATGVNIDRNWYNPNPEDLADEDQCDAINIGRESLSEVETKSLANYLSSIAPTLMLFINVRGFSKIITMPYGYTRDHPENYPIMLEILKSAHKTVYDRYNVTYDYGNAARLLWSCADWVKKELNVPLVYTAYMMHEDYVIPLNSHAKILKAHLSLLLEEILNISKQIYGPLFNSCSAKNAILTPITLLVSFFVKKCI